MAETVGVYKADASLEKLLEEAATAEKPLRFETQHGSYEVRVQREGRPLRRVEDYDAELAREALDESFGVMSDLDAEAFLAEIKAGRE